MDGPDKQLARYGLYVEGINGGCSPYKQHGAACPEARSAVPSEMYTYVMGEYKVAEVSDMAGPMAMLQNESDRLWVSIYDGFSRMSVPLFFIVSAYLLAPMSPNMTNQSARSSSILALKVSRDCEPARRIEVFSPFLKKRNVGIDMMR